MVNDDNGRRKVKFDCQHTAALRRFPFSLVLGIHPVFPLSETDCAGQALVRAARTKPRLYLYYISLVINWSGTPSLAPSRPTSSMYPHDFAFNTSVLSLRATFAPRIVALDFVFCPDQLRTRAKNIKAEPQGDANAGTVGNHFALSRAHRLALSTPIRPRSVINLSTPISPTRISTQCCHF